MENDINEKIDGLTEQLNVKCKAFVIKVKSKFKSQQLLPESFADEYTLGIISAAISGVSDVLEDKFLDESFDRVVEGVKHAAGK